MVMRYESIRGELSLPSLQELWQNGFGILEKGAECKPHDRWVSALRRPVRQALWHLAGSPGPRAHPHLPAPSPPPAGLEEHLYPDRVCPPLSLRDHPRPSVDGRLYPVPQEAQDAPRHPQSRRGQGVAPSPTPPQASRHPRYPLCHGRPRLRTLSAPGHRHRLPTDGDPRAPGQGQTGSLRDALPRPAAAAATLLETLSTPIVALSGP